MELCAGLVYPKFDTANSSKDCENLRERERERERERGREKMFDSLLLIE